MKILKLCCRLLILQVVLLQIAGCGSGGDKRSHETLPVTQVRDPRAEVYYQVFLRSYYDSDGDGQGDFAGLRSKLDLLQELGVTTLWLNPIQSSALYHNYFVDDFVSPDPEFGSVGEFRLLMESAHARGMRILIDMETQYITHDHRWFQESYGKPGTSFSHFVDYLDDDNLQPNSAIAGLSAIPGFDGAMVGVTSLKLNEPDVVDAMKQVYAFWLDPNGDGDLSDGVDGFRIDHTMDDLDDKGRSVHLFSHYWRPIVESARAINPQVFFLAEPAQWSSFGGELLNETRMDAVFDIPLMFAIRSRLAINIWQTLDAGRLERATAQQGLALIENHDMNRIADGELADSRWPYAAAAVNLLLPAPPVIYYGQELGVRGHKVEATNDGADIPVRAAFPWFASGDGFGVAHWYRDSGNWLAEVLANHQPAISLERQYQQPDSLWNFYRELIALRRSEPALWRGDIQRLPVGDEQVLAFGRSDDDGNTRFIVIINLGNQPVSVQPDWSTLTGVNSLTSLRGVLSTAVDQQLLPEELHLGEYQVLLWRVDSLSGQETSLSQR